MNKKVIFVDDENNLLDGLRRMLRQKKDEWDMVFVSSGQEALDNLNGSSFDLVVSDYKMPEMDGLELFESIKIKYPKVKRILLTGQSESEIFDKAKEFVHAYISKPCNSNNLISIIERNI